MNKPEEAVLTNNFGMLTLSQPQHRSTIRKMERVTLDQKIIGAQNPKRKFESKLEMNQQKSFSAKLKTLLTRTMKPTSDFVYHSALLVSLACIYNLVTIPICVFTELNGFSRSIFFALNGLADIIYVYDIFIHMRTYQDTSEEQIWHIRITSKQYFYSKRFMVDLLAVIPVDYIAIYWPHLYCIRINRTLKICRLLQTSDWTLIRSQKPKNYRIFTLAATCFLFFHWNAAIYFLLSLPHNLYDSNRAVWHFTFTKVANPVLPTCDVLFSNEECGFNESNYNVQNREQYIDQMMNYWRSSIKELNFSNFIREYAGSMYWSSLTLTTKGQQPYPETTPQNLMEIVDTIIGCLLFAVIVGSVGHIISTMNSDESTFQELLDGIKLYMEFRNVNPNIQLRVLNCCNYMHEHGLDKDHKILLEGASSKLRAQLAASIHMESLRNVDLFKMSFHLFHDENYLDCSMQTILQNCSNGFLHELVCRMKFQVFSPNDYLCRRGELSKDLYIIQTGKVASVANDDKTVLKYYDAGTVFGQLSILNLSTGVERYWMSIRSCGYVETFILRQEDVYELLQDYPKEEVELIRKANEMIRSERVWEGEIEKETIRARRVSVEQLLRQIDREITILDEQIVFMRNEFNELEQNSKQRLTKLEMIHKANCMRFRKGNKLIWK